MPVILTTKEEMETWPIAPYAEAIKLQRPLPSTFATIVPAPFPMERDPYLAP